jgi:2-keto-3-deoxy-L-fuconate dehydrogenase
VSLEKPGHDLQDYSNPSGEAIIGDRVSSLRFSLNNRGQRIQPPVFTGTAYPVHWFFCVSGGLQLKKVDNLFRLDGLVALITGGASGIGEATSRAFAKAGAKVVIVDLDRQRAEHLALELPNAEVRVCDVTDDQALGEMFRTIPKLDILVNNAGVALVGGIEETEPAEFQRVMRVNVEGMYLVTRHAIPLLVASHGVIVNIGSVAGQIGVKKRFAYCTSKGAVIAMTRQLAVDYPTQLRVNCICPATIETPFVEGYLDKYHRHEKEQARAALHQRQPIGRMGRPDEVAHMALYLASPEAGFITGSALTIDGGWTAS